MSLSLNSFMIKITCYKFIILSRGFFFWKKHIFFPNSSNAFKKNAPRRCNLFVIQEILFFLPLLICQVFLLICLLFYKIMLASRCVSFYKNIKASSKLCIRCLFNLFKNDLNPLVKRQIILSDLAEIHRVNSLYCL